MDEEPIEPAVPTPHTDEETNERAAPTRHVTEAVLALLERHGIGGRQRIGVVQKATDLSYQSARRRLLNRGSWTVDEVQSLAAYFGVPVMSLIEGPGEVAAMTVGATDVACRIWIGPNLGHGPSSPLVALPGAAQGTWRVVPAAEAADRTAQAVKRLHFEAPAPRRIAVLDDDMDLAESISLFLGQKGLHAKAYATLEDLGQAIGTAHFDGFILDWIVSGTSVEALLATLRENQPLAPVIVLTGQMAAANVSEDDVLAATTAHGAVLFEKPTRALLLVNALESGFSTAERGAAA